MTQHSKTATCLLMITMIAAVCARAVNAADIRMTEAATFVYPAENSRDPFVPLIDKTGSSQKGPSDEEIFSSHLKQVKVHGIIWDEAEPVVMINNEIYKPQDEVEGLVISEITPEGITFTYKGLSHTLLLIEKKKYE